MTNQITDYLKIIGKRGGDKTAKRGKAHYQEIGRRGALKRWGVKKASTNSTSQASENTKSNPNLTKNDE